MLNRFRNLNVGPSANFQMGQIGQMGQMNQQLKPNMNPSGNNFWRRFLQQQSNPVLQHQPQSKFHIGIGPSMGFKLF